MSITPRTLLITIATLAVLFYCREGRAASDFALRHVRATDPVIRLTIAVGYERSPTFRRLVDALEVSDLIVYIERHGIPTHESGSLHFVTRSGKVRYTRIRLDIGLSSKALVAMLGHELQHAVEVAEAPWVVDMTTYLELYRAIGHASCVGPRRCFDTFAAIEAGQQVLAELRHAPATATD